MPPAQQQARGLALALVAGFGLVAGLGLVATAVFSRSPRDLGSGVAAADRTATGRPPPRAGGRTSTEEPRRTLGRGVLVAHAAAPDPGGPRVSIEGRCLDPHGTPLAGMAIDLTVVPRSFGRVVERASSGRHPLRVCTAGDGRFATALRIPAHRSVQIRTSMPGRATVQGYSEPGPGGLVRFGDLCIPAGARLAARVVDRDGRALPWLALSLHRPAPADDAQATAVARHDIRTDALGEVITDVALASGRWDLELEEGIRLVEPKGWIDVPAGADSLSVRIVADPGDQPAAIHGHTLDQAGRPVRWVAVEARCEDGRLAGQGCSDAQGRFRIARRTGAAERVYLVVPPTAGFDAQQTRAPWPWGTSHATLTLFPAGDLRVTVVGADDGRPVETFGLAWCRLEASGRCSASGTRWQDTHPGGTAVLYGVPAGRILVVAVPSRGGTLAPNEPVEFFNPPGSAGLRLELPRRTPIEVAVVDGTGRPVEGSLLQLVEWPLGQALTAESEVADPGSRAALLGNTPRGPAVARLLDSARSDAEGRTTLYSGRAAGPLAVRALGPGHVPAVCAQVATHSRGTPLTLVVDRGATLRGTVAWIGEVDAVARTLATAPHLEFTQGQDGSASPLRRCSARVAADGSFRVDALAPGRWEIQARFQGQDGQEVRRRILPPVDLDPGETRGLALEIPR